MSALPLLVLALTACQGGSPSPAGAGSGSAARPAIEARDAKGGLLARVSEGRPCRAMIEGDDLIVGGRPLVLMHGETRWDGADVDGSTVLSRDGAPAGRIYAAGLELAVFDREGIARIRVTAEADGASAIVRDAAQAPLRTARRTPAGVAITFPAGDVTVTGTSDVLLAAILSATELGPEVRALAACHRLLPTEKAAI